MPLSMGAGCPCNTVPLAEAYLGTMWNLDPSRHLASTYIGLKLGKLGGLCPFGDGSLSNAISSGPRYTSLRSGILIHPAVSVQQTWATTSNSIGWSSLVALSN